MSDVPLDAARERYVSLATYRRDGREVRTPVWIAGAGERFYVFSAPEVGKVKRIRANGRVSLAACNYRGVVAGPWREGRARLLDDAPGRATALRALRAKYGVQMWLADVLSKLGGRFDSRVYIEIRL
jgi:PPOX class probable F420-dependent enzyme